jgi:hypothetical protein
MQMTRRTKILVTVAAGILVAFVGLAFLASFGFSGRTVKGRHVAGVDWLPNTANDITYIKNSGGLFPWVCFECSMSPEAVRAFGEEKGWKFTEEKGYSTGLRLALQLPPVRKVDGAALDYYPMALVYENRKGNGGGVTAIYDPELRRLFVHQSSN